MAKHIWYSGATDITGQALADALGLTGTKNKPRHIHAGDIIIGWGTKTDGDVNFGAATVLNHPDKIKNNRNKFLTLQKLKQDRDTGTAIAPFCESGVITQELAKRRPTMKLPLVGRTNFHQGGKGFWLCLNTQHTDRATRDGAQYFQNFINIQDEYRLHVAFGAVIYAVKKVENPADAGWIAQRKEKILAHAAKNDRALEERTVDYVLGRLVKEAGLPDRIIRSNTKGWKFSGVRLDTVPAPLRNAAIKSVEVIGLDFGAVDCAIDLSNTPYIIEINSGPGLQGTSLQKYVDAFTEKINSIERPAAAAADRPRPNARVQNAVGADAADENQGMARLMQNVQNDNEARAVIDALMRRRRE